MKNLRRKGAVWYYDHGGKPRKWESLGRDEATAIRRATQLNAARQVQAGTVAEMLADCMETVAGRVTPGTLANYRIYRKWLCNVFGDDLPETLTQADILEYLDRCPRMTFSGEIGLLSMAFTGWMRKRRLTFNPCLGVRSDRSHSKRDRLLTDGELDAIIAKGNERLAVAIELAYATGLRIGDICALRWADVASGVQTEKTGQRQAFERSEALDAILARARALQARVASLYVLCARGGKQWTPGALRDQWNAACKRAGVLDAHFHDIRAKAGTDKRRQEGREAAQMFLGHRDARTTEVYLRDKVANVVKPMVRRKA